MDVYNESKTKELSLKGAYLTYQITFLSIFAASYLLMKMLSFVFSKHTVSARIFFLTPYLSPRSLRFKGTQPPFAILQTFLMATLLTVILVVLGRNMLMPFNYLKIILISPVIYFMTEAIGALGQLTFSPWYPESYPIHGHPLSSPSLSQFWGNHWNLWVQDWLKDIGSKFSRQRVVRLTGFFLLSGLFHEVMVNLPYWIIYKKSYFGTMMSYFLCQAVALWMDKKFFRHSPSWIRKTFMLLAIFLPAPLFVNIPILTFLGFLS